MKHLTLFLLYALFACLPAAPAGVRTGAEQMETLLPLIKGKRVALVVNQTSRAGSALLPDTLYNIGISITRIFSPEHGFRGDADAGETVGNGKDLRTGIPIVSLYGKYKKPQASQLDDTDAVIFDIQDVGARFYTYASTLYYVMQACAESGKELIVLDRPNPCDYVDGPVRAPAYKSFVGMLPVPILHGCTLGELACMINGEGWLGAKLRCPLRVITAQGWKHGQVYRLETKPSPNLPNAQAIAWYPSLCPFEGTSVSIGRGTGKPFQVIGSPLLHGLPFRFTPQSLQGSDKNPLHKDRPCYGYDLSEENAPEGFSLRYVVRMYKLYQSATKDPEKTFFTRPHWFDLLMGTDQVRLGILQEKTEEQIRAAWQPALDRYKKMREKYLLYPSR